jgi:hypothetical protein
MNSTDIPVGATVYFGNCGGGPCSSCGSSYYGHVGIYVGDGYFVHATGGKVLKSTLSSWGNKYRGWGYCGNFTLKNEYIINGTLVNLGDSFSARIANCSSGKLVTNAKGNVALYSHANDMLAEQIWNFTRNSDGSYKIISCLSGEAIDLDNASDEDGTNIKMYGNYNSNAQDWFIYQRSDGTYYFRSKCSNNRVFDIPGGSFDEGSNIQLWTGNDTDAQKFYISKCASVLNLGDELKSLIINTECWRPIMQTEDGNIVLGEENAENMPKILWHWYRNPDKGFYTIYSYYNGKVLDVENAEDKNGANVQCYNYHDSYAQRWYVLQRDDGSILLKAACASGNLDLQGGSQSIGTNVQMWEGNNTSAQRYSIYQIYPKDAISYNLLTESASVAQGESTKITIKNALYAIDYKLHIVSPSGITNTVELGQRNTYDFSANEKGLYKIYASVKSPVSEFTGSETDRCITIAVGYDYVSSEQYSAVYNGHLYQLIEKQNVNWAQAKSYCEEKNSYIATITSKEENDIVEGLVKAYGKPTFLGGVRKSQNEFRWMLASGDDFVYSNWSDGEPNNTDHGACAIKDPYGEYARENYILMYIDGKWNDTPIFGSTKSFVMESAAKSLVVGNPTKVNYKEGESFDRNSIKVEVTFSDGTKKIVADYAISGFDSNTAGEQKVTISYYGISQNVYVNVNHVYFAEVTKQPTCELSGVRTYTCTKCNDKYTEVIPALGHDYEETVVQPTDTESGYTLHECQRCHTTYKSDFTDPLGHSYSVIEHKDAGCTEEGYDVYKCKDCDDSYKVTIPATGHDYKTIVIAPTCIEKGYKLHKCKNCDESYKDNYTEPTGHNWTGQVTTWPTCTMDGEISLKCSECDVQKTQRYPATGHEYISSVKEPTCHERGYTHHQCKKCNDFYDDIYTDKLEHKYEDVVTKQATCISTGALEHKCKLCGDTHIDIIPMIEHDYVQTLIKSPTCTLKGQCEYKCSYCDDCYFSYIVALEHNYIESIIEPTSTEKGYTVHICDRCGDSYMDNYVEAVIKEENSTSEQVETADKRNEQTTSTYLDIEGVTTINPSENVTMKIGQKITEQTETNTKSTNTYTNNKSKDEPTISSTKLEKVKAKKKVLLVTWKKAKGVTGYKIQYSMNKKFKKSKTKTVNKGSITTITIKKLKTKKKYYIRIRTYKKVNGKIYQSNWSKPMSKKTK